jgi:hypothetical protein
MQSVKHGGIYPLRDFKCLTNGIGMINYMTIHGCGNALLTLTRALEDFDSLASCFNRLKSCTEINPKGIYNDLC